MAEQTIIARKRDISKAYIKNSVISLAGAAAFVVMAILWKEKDPDAVIPFLCIAAAFVVIAALFVATYFAVKHRPEILIWYEDGLIKFYNGYTCEPKDIIDVRCNYNVASTRRRTTIVSSGNLIVVTPRGKIVCRRLSDLILAYNGLMSLKYGKMYMPDELRVLMKKRENEKF